MEIIEDNRPHYKLFKSIKTEEDWNDLIQCGLINARPENVNRYRDPVDYK